MKFLKDLFTEVDNQTWDLSKILATITIISAIYFEYEHITINHAVFSMQDFGVGVGALFTSFAAIFHFKKDSANVAC